MPGYGRRLRHDSRWQNPFLSKCAGSCQIMSVNPPEKFAMLYDRQCNSEAVLMEALKFVAERQGLLYLIGCCNSAPSEAEGGWLPQPADRVADDLVALARMAQAHGLLLDGCVIAEPNTVSLRAILADHGIRHVLRANPNLPGAARAAWSDAMQQAAQALRLPVTFLDTAGRPGHAA